MRLPLRLFLPLFLLFTAVWGGDGRPSQQELDRLVAPIALYPDDLLAQTLMASTYPLEIKEAAKWRNNNENLQGKSLEDALQKQSWDPSVKSLTATHEVLNQLNNNLEWTQKMGNAFLADQKAVMDTIQSLRKKAYDAGTLRSNDKMIVTLEQKSGNTIITIQSPQPEVVYIPTYDPTVVYGTWWYSNPPYYLYPPDYVYPPNLGINHRVLVIAAYRRRCDWETGDIGAGIDHHSTAKPWKHDPMHRKGVAYNNDIMAAKYNRKSDAAEIQSREPFRGKEIVINTPKSELQETSKIQTSANSRLDNVDRTDSQNRREDIDRTKREEIDRADLQKKIEDADKAEISNKRENSLSDIGNSNRTRAASNRGWFSRGTRSRGGGRRR